MKMKKLLSLTTVVVFLCLAAGISAFVYNVVNTYDINKDFTSLPLKFNPDDSSSVYKLNNTEVTIYGGFIKGIQKDSEKGENLVVRALSPLPSITVRSSEASSITLVLENINTDFYVESIASRIFKNPIEKVSANSLLFKFTMAAGEAIKVQPAQPSDESSGKYKYVILGDNRDGYDTFEQIIQQVNGIKPVFVIDNGDLVFSGKPNQYRLFDQLVSQVSTTLCTTLGNHDIRDNGRTTYTRLYGPSYYSFDFGDSHFTFLDSSPGWSEKRAISEEQYAWLEKDLAKASGKHIYVISHIPPKDPRSGVTKNEIPDYVNKMKSGDSWVEQKLSNYNENKDMEHGFQDPQEAARFEKLMSTYHVETVYLSHIHSYFEYNIDGVRYLISGGAGAELLTENSYYHYMISKIGNSNQITMVELPSPANLYIKRYGAVVKLFASAMYKENPAAVVLIITGVVLLLLLIIARLYLREKQPVDTLGVWLYDIVKYSVKRFRELFGKRKES